MMYGVNLARRSELPKTLPAELGQLPRAHEAFEALYGRGPTKDEQQRMKLDLLGEWLIVTMPECAREIASEDGAP